MEQAQTQVLVRGRAAISNRAGRFEPHQTETIDDGWRDDAPAEQLRTRVVEEQPKKIITRNTSPDIPFDRSINPYRGCEHGCIYCFARPTHAFMGLSPGLDFETRLFAKPNASDLLKRELSKKGYKPRPIAIGTNTDPYQPIEKQHEIMRRILQVLGDCNHPVSIVTKSHLVTRDLDILAPMAKAGLAKVALSVTTLDRRLARTMEPRASTPEKRLQAISALTLAGVPTSIMTAPIIPGLTDHELETILERGADAGAGDAGYILLRLPLEIKDLFQEWLAANAPARAKRVMSLILSMRGGQANDPRFGHRMRGQGPFADLISNRFDLACARLGLGQAERGAGLNTSAFVPPIAKDDSWTPQNRQLDLF